MRDAIRTKEYSLTVWNPHSRLELLDLTLCGLWFSRCACVAVRNSTSFFSFFFIFLHLDSEESSSDTSEDVGCSLRRKCDLVRDAARLLQYWSWLYTDSIPSQFCDEVDDFVLHGSFVFSRHYSIQIINRSTRSASHRMKNQNSILKKAKHHEVICFQTAFALACKFLASSIVFQVMVNMWEDKNETIIQVFFIVAVFFVLLESFQLLNCIILLFCILIRQFIWLRQHFSK